MKTAIIYNICPEEIKYFILNGDLTHLQGTYVNFSGEDPDKADELINLLECNNHQEVSILDVQKAVQNGASLIEVGYFL